MEGRWDLGLRHDVQGVEDAPFAYFLGQAASRGLGEVRSESWPTSATEMPYVGPRVLAFRSLNHEAALFERDGSLLHVALAGAHVHVAAAACDRAALDSVLAGLRELFPTPDPSSAHEVPVITHWFPVVFVRLVSRKAAKPTIVNVALLPV